MAQNGKTWKGAGSDLLRGVGGGAIIGLPLVYTMELWFIGMSISDWYIVAFLLFALIVNTGLNHASGFRQQHDPVSDIGASLAALGMSAVTGSAYLLLIGMIRSGISFAAAVSMVSLVAVPISIGFSIANTQFSGKTRTGGDEPDELPGRSDEDIEKRKAKADVRDIGITVETHPNSDRVVSLLLQVPGPDRTKEIFPAVKRVIGPPRYVRPKKSEYGWEWADFRAASVHYVRGTNGKEGSTIVSLFYR